MAGAVIFDMDGLLIDSEPLWVRAEVEVFGASGVVLEPRDCALTKGLRVDDVVAFWHARHGFSIAPELVESRLVERVVELVALEGAALLGVESAIAAARSCGRRVALASSSPLAIIEATLARLGIAGSFDVVQSAQSEAYGKPHPAIFLRTADRLGVAPLDCVVVEDSMTGVVAAKAARMTCLAVPQEPDPRFVLADAVLGSLEEITAELLRRCPGT